MEFNWAQQLDSAVTVCDVNGIVVYMNDKASKTFDKDGGASLIGKSLLDCHNDHSVAIIKDLIANDKKNVYTIEKKGIKKLIYQTPWYKDGQVAGLVEISHEIPFEMPHFVRG